MRKLLSRVSANISQMWLDQPDVNERLALARITTGATALVMLWRAPSADFLAEQEKLLRAAGQPKAWGVLSPRGYRAARIVAMGSIAAWTAGVEHPLVKVAANVSFAAAQRHLAAIHEERWSYTANVNAYLLALSAVDSRWPGKSRPAPGPEASAILASLQAHYGMVYLQSGIAKLRRSGMRWMDGRTVHGSLTELGTPLGKELSRKGLGPASLASISTIAFETGFVPALILAWPGRRYVGLSSIAFHSTIHATMDISFWHHSIYSLPLFILPTSLGRSDYSSLRKIPVRHPSPPSALTYSPTSTS